MRLIHTTIAAALIAFGTVAIAAGDYMSESKMVAEMISKSKMTPSSTDEARKLHADAERMMKEGKEKEAMMLLDQARKVLGMTK